MFNCQLNQQNIDNVGWLFEQKLFLWHWDSLGTLIFVNIFNKTNNVWQLSFILALNESWAKNDKNK